MNRPIPMSQDDLVALLSDILDGVKTGDSLEGSLEWALPYVGDPEDAYAMVRAAYRVGNTAGQGGMMIVGRTTEAAPQTWSLPADPGPEVARLRSGRDGSTWRRWRGDQWQNEYNDAMVGHLARSWEGLLVGWSPLIDVTGEGS